MNILKEFFTKLVIVSFLFSSCFTVVYAQKGKQSSTDKSIVDADKVPEAVMKSYKKRFASASDAVWRFNEVESSYTVKMISRSIEMEAIFDSSGEWMGTTEHWDIAKFSSAWKKTIDLFYQDYKVHSISKQVIKDKEDMIIVQLYEKQNIKKKLLTTVYMDKNGKFISADEPSEDAVTEAEVRSKKQLKEEEKMRKEFDRDRQLDIYPIQLEESELPNNIQKWVRTNYPEYIFKSIDYEEYEGLTKYGSVYQIVIQRSGVNQPHATAWFTRDGNFLRLEDTFNDKYEDATVAKEETTKIKREIPENVVDSFELKYPSAQNVSWEENENGDWNFSFSDRYGENVASYTDVSGQWIETKTTIADPAVKLPAAIRSAVARDFPKEEIVKGWLVKSPGQKNYYIVETYLKKTKETQQLEYWQTGKPRE
jgi:hypothetical protein